MEELDSYIFNLGMIIPAEGEPESLRFQLILNPEADPAHLSDAAMAITEFLTLHYKNMYNLGNDVQDS
jgi:hypothetical protein